MVSAYGGRPVEDVIDLYYLSRRFSWSEIFGYADTKRVPIAYDDLKNSVETSLDSKAISQSTKNLNRV